MSDEILDCVEAGARDDVRASVVWLHGLGADGHDFEAIVPELHLPRDAGVRFVFPHAPVRPITINGGMSMRGWYDLYGLGPGFPQDADGIAESRNRVEALLAREQERGVPAGRIVLAGFSQGGAVALHTGLRYPQRLAGLLALSTYVPLHDTLDAERSEANADLPIFMAHGRMDPVLPFEMGSRSHELLANLGYTVEWHEYPMQHQVCIEEIQAVATWLKRVLDL